MVSSKAWAKRGGMPTTAAEESVDLQASRQRHHQSPHPGDDDDDDVDDDDDDDDDAF